MALLLCALLWLQATPARAVAPQPHPLDEVARETLQRYAAAYNSLDANEVKKVNPSIDVGALTGVFKDLRSLEMKIDEVRVLSSDGATMRVSFRIMQTVTKKIGRGKETNAPWTRVVRLRKQEASWVIDGFER